VVANMSDYSDSKKFNDNIKAYPVNSLETTNLFGRCEPLIVADKLKSRYLKNINLKEYEVEDLKDEIELAINEFELMSGLFVNKVQMKQRVPWDRSLYKAFVYTKLEHKPVLSVEAMSIESSNGENIYNLPASWIEMGNAHKGQINLIPILSIFGAAGLQDGQASNAGLIFLQAINNFQWLPGFFSVTYTVGLSHKEGQVPKIVNDIIGMTAAINILGAKQAQNKYNSTSVSQDGISQSSSSGGTQVYQPRIDQLMERRERLLKKIKSRFSNKYFLSNI
jgi:hypothetical protein